MLEYQQAQLLGKVKVSMTTSPDSAMAHSIVLLYICLQKVSRLGQILPSPQVFPVDTHSPTSTSWTYSCLLSVLFVLRMKRFFPELFLAALAGS